MVKVGDRVEGNSGIGHVEEIDGDWCGVRYLTPKNEPSVLVGWQPLIDVKPVPDNVIPMPRSEEWWAEARAFCAAVEEALR